MELQKFYSMVDYMEYEKGIINNNEEKASIVLIQQPEVIYESDKCCDVDYCKNNNIIHTQEKHMRASCVVMDKGNIILAIKRRNINGKCLANVFSAALRDYLIEKGLPNVVYDSNDILVDGYKVASGAEGEVNSLRYMGYQISINQNMELIKSVCKKPMVKVPKGLSEWGITTENIVEFCKNFWGKY